MKKSKNTYYFPHDSNARNDDKVIALRMRHGAEGYGIYFMILERLLEASDYMSIKDYNIIAFDLRVDAKVVKSVVEEFGLFVFTDDGKYFYSESFQNRMTPLDDVREKRRKAGLKSAKVRWENKESNKNDVLLQQKVTHVTNVLPQKVTEESRVKESKEEEREQRAHAQGDSEKNFPKPDLKSSNLFRKPDIPDYEIIEEYFIRAGGTKEMSLKFFNKYQGAGWYVNGSPIVSWPSLAQNFISNWKQNEQKNQSKNGKNIDEEAYRKGREALGY